MTDLPSRNSTGGGRITQLDGIRALAVTSVFVHHAFKIKLLWMGVDLFFVLSGFLITGILLDNRQKTFRSYIGQFYQRRAVRILPPYVLLLLVTALLFGTTWLRHWYLYLFLMNLVRILGVSQPDSIVLLWSLAVEEQFYIVWPFLVYVLNRKRLVAMAIGIIVLAPFLRWVCTPYLHNIWPIYFLTPFRMDALATGALLAVAWQKFRPRMKAYGQYGLALSLGGALLLYSCSRITGFSTYSNTPLSNLVIFDCTLMICTGIMLWALSGKGVWILTLPPIVYLGRISYSVYLIHSTALVAAGWYWKPGAAAFVAAIGTIVYATLSWYLIEKRLLDGSPAKKDLVRNSVALEAQ